MGAFPSNLLTTGGPQLKGLWGPDIESRHALFSLLRPAICAIGKASCKLVHY